MTGRYGTRCVKASLLGSLRNRERDIFSVSLRENGLILEQAELNFNITTGIGSTVCDTQILIKQIANGV